jgi:isopentenyldiphosphate isomerase
MTGDEFVDVVDACDRVIAQVPRWRVRRDTLRHRAVYILVFDTAGRVLIHRRTPTKDVFPGYWDVCVGGVPRAGESYDEAARRELGEEIGVTEAALHAVSAMQYEDEHTSIRGMVYRCTVRALGTLQASEVATVEWVSIDSVPRAFAERSFCPDGLAALDLFRARVRSSV